MARRIHRMLDRLAAEEQGFLGREFLAPAVRGGQVRVKIAGVICTLSIAPRDFEGFGVFRATSLQQADLVRRAGMAECREYLQLLPLLWLILCERQEHEWLSLPAHRGDGRFRIEGAVPLRMVDEAGQFDVVRARFDGANFWCEGAEPRYDPARGAYLREALRNLVVPESLDRPGLTPEERAAYVLQYFQRPEVRRQLADAAAAAGDDPAVGPGDAFDGVLDHVERRLRQALAHAGAEFVDYAVHRDGYRVTYEVGGERHVSSIDRRDFTVQVAGICLSGQDANFDLASLVGVLHEAGGGVLPVGRGNGGIDEDHYWRAHPRRR